MDSNIFSRKLARFRSDAGAAGAFPFLALALMTVPAEASPVCRYDVSVSAAFVVETDVHCDAPVRGFQFIEPIVEHYATLAFPEPHDTRRARYRLDLGRLAAERNDVGTALVAGRSVLATGGSWLLRPIADDVTLEIRVRTAPGVDFATGVAISDGVLRLNARGLDYVGFAAFGRLRREPVSVPGRDGRDASIELVYLEGALALPRAELTAWIERTARLMAGFWHGFPAERSMLAIVPRAGVAGIPFGRVMGGGGVSIALFIGDQARHAALADDWVLIHELVHVGTPFLVRGPWFMEGLATYLEPVIRARAGLRAAADTWAEFARNMPRGAAAIADGGLAASGFRGLYWGGAVLMLLADVEIRKQSGSARGLEDCLRDVLARVGNATHAIDVEDMVAACDRALGGDVVRRLVERHAYAATPIDLEALWADLGVRLDGHRALLDDSAPLAGVREAIIRGGPPPK
jgi:hypothetical protein